MDPKYKYEGTTGYPPLPPPLFPLSLPPCYTVDLVMFYELKSVLFNCLAQ